MLTASVENMLVTSFGRTLETGVVRQLEVGIEAIIFI